MNWSQIFMIVLFTMLITIGGTYWVLKLIFLQPALPQLRLTKKKKKSK